MVVPPAATLTMNYSDIDLKGEHTSSYESAQAGKQTLNDGVADNNKVDWYQGLWRYFVKKKIAPLLREIHDVAGHFPSFSKKIFDISGCSYHGLADFDPEAIEIFNI